MAQHTTITLPGNEWQLLTNADVAEALFQNQTNFNVLVQATSGNTAPTGREGSIQFGPNEGEKIILADRFPGVAGANRLWAIGNGPVVISHQ